MPKLLAGMSFICRVYLRGILREGREKGFLELKPPSSYNVVLYNGTYEGELKIGLKFISNVSNIHAYISLKLTYKDNIYIQKLNPVLNKISMLYSFLFGILEHERSDPNWV